MIQTHRHPDMLKRNTRNTNNKFTNRNRGGGGGGGGGHGGGGHRSNTAQRHNLQQTFERYLSLAREASGAGDRVLAENYYQYAEHYLRTLNDMKPVELEIPLEEALNEEAGVVAPVPQVSEEPARGPRRRRERPQPPQE